MLWEIDIYPAPGQADLLAQQVANSATELGLATGLQVSSAVGYLIQGDLPREQLDQLARELFADPIVERAVVGRVGEDVLNQPAQQGSTSIHVLPKPGVMDPVASTAVAAIADLGFSVEAVRTLRKFWVTSLPASKLQALVSKVLANDAIEQVIVGPLTLDRLDEGTEYRFKLVTVPLRELDDGALVKLSRDGQLALSLEELKCIQKHFREIDRDPTDAELETLAQTWSEHCSHKTLAGRIAYRGPLGAQQPGGITQHYFENMLEETIFAATRKIRAAWQESGRDDRCVSVFDDHAGIVRFDDQHHLAFKVETHNHPSALEPYGGASTGVGGVIRDILAAGGGAKPVANTDVFCFASLDTQPDDLRGSTLHPRRVMNGVVAGVRDYSNRLGIPTVSGAIYFDQRYLGNPLVFCGSVGILPAGQSRKEAQPGDLLVLLGGRTGRDGIHGATFSSGELAGNSQSRSGGAVQIGNPITERMLLDVVLAARDRQLYTAIADCGAGGLSSAIGEMARHIGAIVRLDSVPLKYTGLTYTEIWISESQERMVLAVPPQLWPELQELCDSEGVEAAAIGDIRLTKRLQLFYDDQQVADLSMDFLHAGRPAPVREAVYVAPQESALRPISPQKQLDFNAALVKILRSPNVCSREWVVRQYDHEVQGTSVIKPLVGRQSDGPSDAAVLRPVPGSKRGLILSCGMNPCYGDFDTYHMAASTIDEAVRNCVAVGADPSRIALVDNFCWGDCQRPEILGSLVRAAQACHDVAVALSTPFISGKDSLNNELRVGEYRSAVPPSLLISALGQVADVSRCVTMDLKHPGNVLYQVGCTRCELGGSHFAMVEGLSGGNVPQVDAVCAKATFAAMHKAIHAGFVCACHDLSEGGLAVAAAEMAFAGGLGARLYLIEVQHQISAGEAATIPGGIATALLFAESNSRFLVEVCEDAVGHFEEMLGDVPHSAVGEVTELARLIVADVDPLAERHLIDIDIASLKEVWQKPLRW